jgi:hypothetical protein
MAHIETIGPWRARGEVGAAYRALRRELVGKLPVPASLAVWNIMRVFSLRPALLQAFGQCFLLTMWGGPLRRSAKEAIGVTVARTNSCHY